MDRDKIPPKKLRKKVHNLLDIGLVPIPSIPGYGGTGAVGRILEEHCGLRANNHDTADSCGWEFKACSGSALISLFHKDPLPEGFSRLVLNSRGYTGRDGARQFRNTISGNKPSSRDCTVVVSGDRIEVHVSGMTEVGYWDVDAIKVLASRKIGRLILVSYKKETNGYRYTKAEIFSKFSVSKFLDCISNGVVKVELDISEKQKHDHGPKFRIWYKDLGKLYDYTALFPQK